MGPFKLASEGCFFTAIATGSEDEVTFTWETNHDWENEPDGRVQDLQYLYMAGQIQHTQPRSLIGTVVDSFWFFLSNESQPIPADGPFRIQVTARYGPKQATVTLDLEDWQRCVWSG